MVKGGRPLKVHSDLENLDSIIESGDLPALKAIVSNHGVDSYNSHKRSALILACHSNRVQLVNWLLERGSNVHHKDKNGHSALHFCAQKSNYEIAKVLLNHQANPNLQDNHGNTPLWTALFNAKGNFELVKLLSHYGANPDIKNQHQRSPNDMAGTMYKVPIDQLI